MPSGCSHDQWNGHPDLDDGAPEFKNAAQTRYSYAALLETLDWVDDQYGIEYLYVVGGSGGGTGGFLLADRLPDGRPGIDLRGVVSEAAAPEAEAREDLFDPSDERDVYADDSCTGTQATVPCEAPAEPFATANVEVGLTGYSISTEIANLEVTVPILHMYNKRDFTHCYDFCYSETDLHGAIREAIEDRTDGGWDEDFDASASVAMCVGECDADGVLLECTDHTVLGWRESSPVAAAVTCAVDWIKEVNDYHEGVTSTTQLPTACSNIEARTGGTSPDDCVEQSESLF